MKFDFDDLICAAATIEKGNDVSLDERAAAAAAAGFKAIGLRDGQYEAELAAGRSDDEMRAILERHGVSCTEIEGLYSWAATGDGPGPPGLGKIDWRERLEVLLHMADVFDARYMICGEVGFYGPLLPIDEIADRFGAICDRAAEHGLLCVLEFLAWSEMPDAASVWEVVRRANRDNGGLLVDAWHYFRGGTDPDQLRAIPGEQIRAVHSNDGGPLEGKLLEDAGKRRLVPGGGQFDLIGLLGVLDEIGATPSISVEVMSDELAELPLADRARKAREGALDVLCSAGVVA